MAKHQRQIIREAARELLIAANTGAAERVFSNRKDPWRKGELPGISIDSVEEDSQLANFEGALARVAQFAVVVVVSLDERDGNELDAAALEVENALGKDRTLGGTAMTSHLVRTELGLTDEAGQPVGAVRLVFQVSYKTPAPA